MKTGWIGLALFLTATPAPAGEPQCRFPGPWQRPAPTVRASHGGHLSPLQIAADPSVLHEDGVYKMWFTNADSRGRTGVAFAQSADGIVWDVWKAAANSDATMDLVLAPPPGGWDAPGIETPHVLRVPGGGYRLYYSGNRTPEGSVTYAIGMAESPDGINWTRRERPVFEPAADWERPECDGSACRRGGVLEPSVLYDTATSQYRMWYAGLGLKSGTFRTYRIGHATSPDGIAWTRQANPVLDLGRGAAWDSMWTSHVEVVADPKAGFHMFYFGSALKDFTEGAEIQRGSIGHAYSADGLKWQRDPGNPILSPVAGQPDAWSAGGPSVLAEDGRLRMWYFGNPAAGLKSNIMRAEAACAP